MGGVTGGLTYARKRVAQQNEDVLMGAKRKLNSIHATSAVVVAAMIGGAAQSWTVFAVVLAVLLVVGFHNGAIRR
jgi:hypothetical protein